MALKNRRQSLYHKYAKAISANHLSPQFKLRIAPDYSWYPDDHTKDVRLSVNDIHNNVVIVLNIPPPHRIVQSSSFEQKLLHIVTRTQYKNTTKIDVKRYSFDFAEMDRSFLHNVIDAIYKTTDPRTNYSWIEPLQDLIIKSEMNSLKRNKNVITKTQAWEAPAFAEALLREQRAGILRKATKIKRADPPPVSMTNSDTYSVNRTLTPFGSLLYDLSYGTNSTDIFGAAVSATSSTPCYVDLGNTPKCEGEPQQEEEGPEYDYDPGDNTDNF
jgi:hypothetical protein